MSGAELRSRPRSTSSPASAKRVRLNGARLASGEELRSRLSALAFTPDRLAVVKGGPIVRRAYLDRMLGRAFPSRAKLPSDYGRAVAQRNAALRRVRAGESLRLDSVEPWTAQVAALGAELDRSAAPSSRRRSAPGSRSMRSRSASRAPCSRTTRKASPSRSWTSGSTRDLERGTTGCGPASSRCVDHRRRPRPARLRLTGGAAHGRPRAGPGGGRASRRSPGRAAASPARRRLQRARHRTAEQRSSHAARGRSDGDHRDRATGRGRAGPDRLGHSRRGEGGGVRFGPLRIRSRTRSAASSRASARLRELGDIVAGWPECVGAAIAANAWPAGSRGTAPSTSRPARARGRSSSRSSRRRSSTPAGAPGRVRARPRFASLRALFRRPDRKLRKLSSGPCRNPPRSRRAEGARIAASIEDQALREAVAKALAASLAAAEAPPDDRLDLIHLIRAETSH